MQNIDDSIVTIFETAFEDSLIFDSTLAACCKYKNIDIATLRLEVLEIKARCALFLKKIENL